MDHAVEQRTVLPPSEQTSRGRELLEILGVPLRPFELDESKMQDIDVAVVVKHTFIEVVDPSIRSLSRSMSDSALLSVKTDMEKPWDSEKPWKMRLADKFQDLSDASTNVSLDAEDVGGLETPTRPERKDTCWSDDEDGALYSSSVPYQFVESWWIPMGYDTFMPVQWEDQTQWDEQAQWDDQSQWHEQTLGECQTRETHAESQEWRTTVMLRNMPNNYTRDMLLELVETMGFDGKYDFVYLPVDFKSQAGLGYAFVNFISSTEALKCFDMFEGFSDWTVPSEKVCTVTWGSPYQGLQAHIERYQNSPVMHHSIADEWKPALFDGGVRYPFPPPTKSIKTPKIRQTTQGQTQS
jgi:hypothetical protein